MEKRSFGRVFTLILLFVAVAHSSAMAWSKKGHDVTAYIAENHLDEDVLERVEAVLGGYSMVYWAAWMDTASNSPEYKYSKTWHYFNLEPKGRINKTEREEKGDVMSALVDIEAKLRSGKLSAEDEAVALKMYIHMMGDMHQPMHLGRKDDLGGNRVPVIYFSDSTNLHSMWDYNIVEGSRNWSYSEWQREIDRATPEQQAKIVSGDYADWVEQTHEVTRKIYKETPAETRVYYGDF